MNLTIEQKIKLAKLAGLTINKTHDNVYSLLDEQDNLYKWLISWLDVRGEIDWNDIQLIKEGIRNNDFMYQITVNGSLVDISIDSNKYTEIEMYDYHWEESEAILTAALKVCEHLNITAE